MTNQLLFAFLLFLSGLLCSCTETIEPKLSVNQPPIVVRYPLHIGFYHGDKYSKYIPKFFSADSSDTYIDILTGPSYVYNLSGPSARFFESNLKAMFEKVEVVRDFPKDLPENIDGIITAEIESFVSPFDDVSKPPSQADIVYIFSLYDNKNKLLASLKVTGIGRSNIRFGLSPRFQDAVELAIKDAMAQFMVAFEKHPPFKRWLQEQSNKQIEKPANTYE